MPEIKNLTDKAGTVVYPKTSSDAVDVNGTILTDILNNIKIIDIETIEELKTMSLPLGTHIHMLNYYTNDNIEHNRIISDTDNGTGVQLSNNLYANIPDCKQLNALWLGIKRSGDIFDLSELEEQSNKFNKVKAVKNLNSFREIYFPAGYYSFGVKGLILGQPNDILSIVGEGNSWKPVYIFFRNLQSDQYAISTHPSCSINEQNWAGLSISGISLDGQGCKCEGGIKIAYTPNVTFKNVLIGGFYGHGLHILKCEDSVFDQVSIFSCGRNNLDNNTITTNLYRNSNGEYYPKYKFAEVSRPQSPSGENDYFIPADEAEYNNAAYSEYFALYLERKNEDNDANNMIRFRDCRIEKNNSYPYVSALHQGGMWIVFEGLHAETDGTLGTFMQSDGSILTFTDCHIEGNQFKWTLVNGYGNTYVNNSRYFSLLAPLHNNISSTMLNNVESSKFINTSSTAQLQATNTNFEFLSHRMCSNIFVSNSCINKLDNTGTRYNDSVALFSNCKITSSTDKTTNDYIMYSNCIFES